MFSQPKAWSRPRRRSGRRPNQYPTQPWDLCSAALLRLVSGAQEEAAPHPSKWGGLPLRFIYLYLNLRSSLRGRRARCPGFVATWPRKPRKLEKTEKTEKTQENSRKPRKPGKLKKTHENRENSSPPKPLELARPRWGARNGRSSLLGVAGAGEIAAQACSVGRNRCSGLLGGPRWSARLRCSSLLG